MSAVSREREVESLRQRVQMASMGTDKRAEIAKRILSYSDLRSVIQRAYRSVKKGKP